jgi:hypothetical protein
MGRDPNDGIIGLAVLALAVAVSLMTGGMSALFYGGGFVVFGVIVLILLNRRSEGAKLIAVILMPAVLLGKLLPKDVRAQLGRIEKKTVRNDEITAILDAIF